MIGNCNKKLSIILRLSQKLSALLYEAADEVGCVNPDKVHDILGISKDEAVGNSKTTATETVTGLTVIRLQSDSKHL